MVVDLRKAAENMTFEEDLDNFQTPDFIIEYMISLNKISPNISIFEPTAGAGNLVRALEQKGYTVDSNEGRDFDSIQPLKKYFVIMGNPPFSPMKKAYDIFDRCFDEFLYNEGFIIMVMPIKWLTNATLRTKKYFKYIKSVAILDRRAFKGSKIEAIIVEIQKLRHTALDVLNPELKYLPTPM